jgi:hypothetical protein
MVDAKEVWMEFPGVEGFEILVTNLSRKEMMKMRKACTTQKWDKKVRGLIEALDEEKFVEVFCEKTIKDWRGLKLKDVAGLVLMDIGAEDPEQNVEFTLENAQLIMENSVEFDNWLNDVVFDLDNFRN